MCHSLFLLIKRKLKKLLYTIQEKPSPMPYPLLIPFVLWLIAQGVYVYSLVGHIINGKIINDILFWPILPIWQATALDSDKFPIWHCILASLPALFISFVLLCNCHLYFHPWSNGSICGSTFWLSESIQRIIRVLVYTFCFAYICLTYSNKSFIENRVFMFVSTIHAIPLFISILQSTFRLNFRRMINYVISLSNIIIYLVLLDNSCVGFQFLGLFGSNEDRTAFAAIFADYSGVLGIGILITIVAVILEESIKNLLAAITSRHPANLSQRRRRNRRRLLTHWHYEKDRTVSSWEDSAVVMLGVEIAVFCISALLVTLWPGHDTESAASAVTDAVQSATTNTNLPLGIYPLSLAALLFIPSMMSTWTPSDEKLIQSEYTYLITKSSQMEPEDIRHSSNRWTDFCQVVVNLYTNVSGLESEDRAFHRLKPFFSQLRDYLGKNCICANSKYFSDILSFKGNISAKLLREAAHEDLDDEKSYHKRDSMIQRARDLQFASIFRELMYTHWKDSKEHIKKPIEEQDPLFFIENLSMNFFKNRDHVWGQRFGAYNLSAHDGIKLLQMDTLIHILRRESGSHCGLAWLGCSCSNHPDACNDFQINLNVDTIQNDNLQFIRNRMELMLIYPFIVIDCYKQRWNDQIDHFPLEDDIYTYYLNLIKQQGYIKRNFPMLKKEASVIYMGQNSQNLSAFDSFIVELVYGAYTYLTESMANTTLLKLVDSKIMELDNQLRRYDRDPSRKKDWYSNFLGSKACSRRTMDAVKPSFMSHLKTRALKKYAVSIPDNVEYDILSKSVDKMHKELTTCELTYKAKSDEYSKQAEQRKKKIADTENAIEKQREGSPRHSYLQQNLEMLEYDNQFVSQIHQTELVKLKIRIDRISEDLAREEECLKAYEERKKNQQNEISSNIQNYIQPLFRIAYAIFNQSKGGTPS